MFKGEDGKVLVEETEIMERWRSYFFRLFNGESEYSLSLERERGSGEAPK